MDDHENDHAAGIAEDRELLGLLGMAVKTESNPFERPDDDSIHAYINDTATARQRSEVQNALMQSPAFRREILSLEEDLRRLDESESQQRFEAVEADEIPGVHTVRPAGQSGPHIPGQGQDARKMGGSDRVRSWVALILGGRRNPGESSRPLFNGANRRLWGWSLAGLSAVAVLILLAVLRMDLFRWESRGIHVAELLAFGSVPRSVFEPVRSGDPDHDHTVRPTARVAATHSFMSRVELSEGVFHLVPREAPEITAEWDYDLHLEVAVGDRATRHAVTLQLPGDAESVQVWLLGVPSLTLHAGDVRGENVRVVAPSGPDDRWCVTATFAVSGGYMATEAVPVTGW